MYFIWVFRKIVPLTVAISGTIYRNCVVIQFEKVFKNLYNGVFKPYTRSQNGLERPLPKEVVSIVVIFFMYLMYSSSAAGEKIEN